MHAINRTQGKTTIRTSRGPASYAHPRKKSSSEGTEFETYRSCTCIWPEVWALNFGGNEKWARFEASKRLRPGLSRLSTVLGRSHES